MQILKGRQSPPAGFKPLCIARKQLLPLFPDQPYARIHPGHKQIRRTAALINPQKTPELFLTHSLTVPVQKRGLRQRWQSFM